MVPVHSAATRKQAMTTIAIIPTIFNPTGIKIVYLNATVIG